MRSSERSESTRVKGIPSCWPFEDQAFDLGLCSHCLEDIRDPLPAVGELGRCCKHTLIVCPSRLFEQMKGVDHLYSDNYISRLATIRLPV